MKRISSLNDLLMEELADLLNAENQLIEALPKMMQASQSQALKLILEGHLELTKEHAHRLQDVFNNIMQNSQRGTCQAVKGFIQESEDVVRNTDNGPARDAAIISVAQRVEHYEISGYVTAREHASDLGHIRTVGLLEKTLNEERVMNSYLNELAQCLINIQAIDPKNERRRTTGFYIPEGKFERRGIMKKGKAEDVSRFIDEGNPNIQEPNGAG